MRIEGCSRDAATNKRPDQRAFRGELELNGLLVSAQGSEEFSAWTDTTMARDGIRYDLTTVAHLKRSATTRLYLDANIAGSASTRARSTCRRPPGRTSIRASRSPAARWTSLSTARRPCSACNCGRRSRTPSWTPTA
jgi:hypothetical protein